MSGQVRYRIHPALAFVRVGDASREDGGGYYLGPELPGVHAGRREDGSFQPFKAHGRVLARGARFRVFAYENGAPPREVPLDGSAEVEEAEWSVEIANRKAAFFKFLGPLGEATLYANPLLYLPFFKRNAHQYGEAREALVLRSGKVTIASRRKHERVVLPNRSALTSGRIAELGDLRVDEKGRLIVCGGHGRTAYLAELNGGKPRDASLESFANNDGWFDDIADGPVGVMLKMRDGRVLELSGDDGAWVASAPPDFAPALSPMRSYWDTLMDLYVRTRAHDLERAPEFAGSMWLELAREWAKTGTLGVCRVRFTRDIYPILRAAAGVPAVFSVASRPIAHHRFEPWLVAQLGGPRSSAEARQAVFRRIRPPQHRAYDVSQMPLANGDSIPLHPGDEPAWYDRLVPLAARARLFPRPLGTLTSLQYALLERWASGDFEEDWQGEPPPPAREATPLDLEQAALETAVGGAFFPGIEASWLLASGRLFGGALRLRRGETLTSVSGIGPVVVEPGIVTAQMALPWHADFASCKKTLDASGRYHVGWWPTQRPDDVLVRAEDSSLVPRAWARGADDLRSAERHIRMVDEWSTHGFVIEHDGDYFEQP
jgi:hypothetical protein